MPATETGKTLGRKTSRTWPNSPKNLQQPLDPGHESLWKYNNCLYLFVCSFVRSFCISVPLVSEHYSGWVATRKVENKKIQIEILKPISETLLLAVVTKWISKSRSSSIALKAIPLEIHSSRKRLWPSCPSEKHLGWKQRWWTGDWQK